MNGYRQWQQRPDHPIDVQVDVEAIDVPDFRLGVMECKRTGRVRFVIEGEQELVGQLLGKNWLKRCERVLKVLR